MDEVRPVHLLFALTEEGSGVRDVLAAHGITDGCRGRLPRVSRRRPRRPPWVTTTPRRCVRSASTSTPSVRPSSASSAKVPSTRTPPRTSRATADAPRSGDDDEDAWAARRRFGLGGRIRFGRGSKKVLELSLREALRTGAREIRTEHIALGVLRADDEAVTMLLRTLGTDPRAVRADLEDRGRRTA